MAATLTLSLSQGQGPEALFSWWVLEFQGASHLCLSLSLSFFFLFVAASLLREAVKGGRERMCLQLFSSSQFWLVGT